MKKILEKSLFCENLVRIRTSKKLSGNQLAHNVGINQTTYSSWERGRTEPPLLMVVKLAQALGCSCDELLGAEPPTSTASVCVTNSDNNSINSNNVSNTSSADCKNCQHITRLTNIIEQLLKGK